MDAINEFLKRTLKQETVCGLLFQDNRPRLKCLDGFSVSIQASAYHYCHPRVNGVATYDSVELGFPSAEDPLITEYAEDPDIPSDTVYGYVPIDIVNKLVEKHGGIVYEEES